MKITYKDRNIQLPLTYFEKLHLPVTGELYMNFFKSIIILQPNKDLNYNFLELFKFNKLYNPDSFLDLFLKEHDVNMPIKILLPKIINSLNNSSLGTNYNICVSPQKQLGILNLNILIKRPNSKIHISFLSLICSTKTISVKFIIDKTLHLSYYFSLPKGNSVVQKKSKSRYRSDSSWKDFIDDVSYIYKEAVTNETK